MTKQNIIDYVMNTPHNTNKAVLSSMLNQLAESGGGIFVVTTSKPDGQQAHVLDKTWEEMFTAANNGMLVIIREYASLDDDVVDKGIYYSFIEAIEHEIGNLYRISVQGYYYTCESPSDYPVEDLG